jgi:tetratricopeptide (TPR) repeat protein/transcriptional regulator with XRE-family HTH domain
MPPKRPTHPKDALRQARQLRGWSQEEVAERVGTNGFTVSRWELGQAFPSPFYRQQLSILFGQSPEALGLVSTRRQRVASERASQPPHSTGDVPQATLVVEDPLLPPAAFLSSRLIGRDPLLAQLKARLLAGETLVLSALQGLPGVGKTALALALAHDEEVRAHFADGLLWIGLGRTPQVQENLARWGELLGISPGEAARLTTTPAWAQALRRAIGSRRLLIVLDDVWSLEAVLACQVGGEGCAHLVTTRLPDLALQVAGESWLAVPELPVEDGLTLLTQLAPQAVEAEPAAAHALVESVGGLPLALILMGKYLHREAYGGQPRRIRAALARLKESTERLRLAEPQALLSAHPSLPVGTPLSLQASIGLSVAALSGEAQALLQALAIFPPKPTSFSEEAALVVGAGGGETLDLLVETGLMERAGLGRYRLHQAIIDFARVSGVQTEAEQRYLAWAVGWITLHQEEESLLEQELPLLLDALRCAGAEKDRALLIQGGTTLAPFLLDRGWYTPAEELLQQALTAARTLEDREGLLRSQYHLSRIAERRGDYAQAEALLQSGILLARAQGDPTHRSLFLMGLGYLQSLRGELRLAQDTLEAALAVARQGGTPETQSRILGHLGAVFENQGNALQAIQWYQEAWELAQHANRPYLACAALDGLTSAALRLGDYTQAETAGRAAAALARQHGYRDRLAAALSNVGIVALDQGRFQQAEEAFSEVLQWERVLGHREGLCRALCNLSEARLRLGRLAEGESTLEEALSLARQLEHQEYICHALRLCGELQFQQGHLAEAEAALEEGMALARASGYRWVLSAQLCGWGDVQLAQQRGEAAQAAFSEARFIARQIESQELEAIACYGLARLAASRGEHEQAREQGERSWQLFTAHGLYQAAAVEQWLESLSTSPANRATSPARRRR